MPREYVRDSRSPIPSNGHISKVMSSNKAKNTSPELLLRRALRENGAGGYRLQWDVPGRPDIAYPGRKVAIFVNGCFWHRCPLCDLPLPKSNVDFWRNKFEKNRERDQKKNDLLEANGWRVITVWECGIKSNLKSVTDMILSALNEK